MFGECDTLIVVPAKVAGETTVRFCGQPGTERPELSSALIGPVLCDEHYEAEKARRPM